MEHIYSYIHFAELQCMRGIGAPFYFRVIPTYRVLSHSMIICTYVRTLLSACVCIHL